MVMVSIYEDYVRAAVRWIALQRHLSVLTKSTHVESRFCGRSRQVKAAFCTPVNPCVRSVCSRSVVVGLMALEIVDLSIPVSLAACPSERCMRVALLVSGLLIVVRPIASNRIYNHDEGKK